MFQTAEGVYIPFPEKIREEYKVFEKKLIFNLSFEKLEPMLLDFLDQLEGPLFLVLELPLPLDEEEALRKNETGPLHRKVCYLDGQSKQQIQDILYKYKDILLNDGMSRFGVATHTGVNEMFIDKYKIILIYSDDISKYFSLLARYGVTQTTDLVTAWSTFTKETPGHASLIERDGVNVYNVYDELVKLGMYEAKIVNDSDLQFSPAL